MSSHTHTFDRPFFIGVVILVIFGFFIFISASMGLLARENIAFHDVVLNQFLLGLVGGSGALFIISNIHYRVWRSYAFAIFAGSLILTALVFIPPLGFEAGGARRWLNLGPFSLQPAEFLKIGFVIYFAAWLSRIKDDVKTIKYGLVPFCILLAFVGSLLLTQPDNATFGVILIAGISIFVVAGAKWRHIGLILLFGVIVAGMIMVTRPYVADRVMTFFNPVADPLGSGYQIQQSLIAIGSGGLTGRGFGQSIQKFDFLPEPRSDSIFAVAAEEFGFIGSIAIVLLFLFFAYRGLYIAARAPDMFARLTVVGIVILITAQSFMNIAAMLELIPLSGMPLLFISHGGTALFIALAETGIILNVSKYVAQ